MTDRCIIGEGTEIYGEVHNSVIGPNVVISRGAVVEDSIIMRNSTVGENTILNKAIIAEDVTIGDNVTVGFGEEAENVLKPAVYAFGLATIGENSVIPDNVKIGREYSHIRCNNSNKLSRRRTCKWTGDQSKGW